MRSVRASLSRLVFKAATSRAATAKLQGRGRLLFALEAICDRLRSKPPVCLLFQAIPPTVSVSLCRPRQALEKDILSSDVTLSTG